MLQNILLLLMVYTAIFLHDGPKLRNSGGKEKIAYGLLIAYSLYMSVIFALELPWPNVDDLIHFVLEPPAKRIVETVKMPVKVPS
ncbi:hypothetical protein [Paenibacillus alkalitolerans]|uniref:hypothetical protein n=1 Tax=Paenibacillus alkalitolerans TaxID=2799335 RepID=UPI0018F7CB86|nr:hypothetical protein [Paenibacillus alkalitolerans]